MMHEFTGFPGKITHAHTVRTPLKGPGYEATTTYIIYSYGTPSTNYIAAVLYLAVVHL